MNPYEMNEVIKRLRNGEKVLCHHCKRGYFETKGDCKLSGKTEIRTKPKATSGFLPCSKAARS